MSGELPLLLIDQVWLGSSAAPSRLLRRYFGSERNSFSIPSRYRRLHGISIFIKEMDLVVPVVMFVRFVFRIVGTANNQESNTNLHFFVARMIDSYDITSLRSVKWKIHTTYGIWCPCCGPASSMKP